jgi:hypothetical protein
VLPLRPVALPNASYFEYGRSIDAIVVTHIKLEHSNIKGKDSTIDEKDLELF